MNKNNLEKFVLFSFPFLVFCLIEGLFAGGISPFLNWLFHEPFYAILSLVFVYCSIFLFLFLKSSIYKIMATLVGLFLLIIAFISRTKYQYRGDILTFSDLSLLNEASDISSYLDTTLYIKLGTFVLLFLIICLPLYLMRPLTKSWKTKAILSCSSFLFILVLGWVGSQLFTVNQDEKLPGKNSVGYVSGLISQWYPKNKNDYSDYSHNQINEIVKSFTPSEQNNDFKPNVIMVLSEAFWDPTQLEGVQFTEDPIPFFHSLAKEFSSGSLLSPVFGGSTANAEFESLTGLSTRFIDEPTPYNQVIDQPLDSLASIFKRQGYSASAIHSYHNWFYNRPTVYQYLGFDKFISGEFFNSPSMIGPFMDDRDLYKSVIHEMKDTNNSDFIYTITMSNHGPYSADRYVNYDKNLDLVAGEMSESSRGILNAYSNSLRYADEAFEQLITNLNNFGEPTIVVFFGDHLPLLGEDYSVYKELNFFDSEDTPEEYTKKYTTPVLVWNNFGAKKEDLGLLSTNFIGEYVLRLSQKQGNNIFSALSSLRREGITVMPKEKFYQKFQVSERQLKDFQLLQYDILFGNDFSSTNPDYPTTLQRGSTNITINGTNPTKLVAGMAFNKTDEGYSVLQVSGAGFIPKSPYFDFIKGSQIYINNQPYETTYINENSLSTNVPAQLYSQVGTLQVDVRIADTKDNTLSKSSTVTIPIQSPESTVPIIRWAEPGEIKSSVLFNEADGNSYLRLAAEGLTDDSQIYINDTPMQTSIENNGYIQCIVPKSLYSQPTRLKIEIRNPNGESDQVDLYVTN